MSAHMYVPRTNRTGIGDVFFDRPIKLIMYLIRLITCVLCA